MIGNSSAILQLFSALSLLALSNSPFWGSSFPMEFPNMWLETDLSRQPINFSIIIMCVSYSAKNIMWFLWMLTFNPDKIT